MIDTPSYSDNSIKVAPGAVTPKIAGHGTGTIQQVKPEMLLNAVVTKPDSEGNPVLRTPVGDITVSTKLQLLQGNNVVLKVLVNNPILTPPPNSQLPYNFQASVVTIDGQTPPVPTSGVQTGQLAHNIVTALAIHSLSYQAAGASAQQSVVPQQAPIQTAPNMVASPDAAIVNVSNGMVLDSVVIDVRRSASTYLPQTSVPLKSSDAIVLHVLSTKIPASTQQPSAPVSVPAGQPTPNNVSNQTAITNQPLPQSSGGDGLKPQAGYTVTNPSLGGTPQTQTPVSRNIPYATTTPPPTVLPGQEMPADSGRINVPTQTTQVTNNPTFTGVVVGTEKSGEVVLKTPVGMLKLEAGFNLPKGTELTLEVMRFTPSANSGLVLDRAGDLGIRTLFDEQKILMGELVSAAMKGGEEILDAVKNRIPAADKQMVAKMLWFLAGVKKGDERFWLGRETSQHLEQAGKADLLNALKGHFGSLARLADGMPNSSWNLFLFPFFDGEHLQHGLMFTHRDEEDEDGDQDGQRFVVEVDLSNIGEMQIDGFIKDAKSNKELDLYVRTKNSIDSELEGGIREKFMETIEIMGINGTIQFQVVGEFPVNPSEELGDEVTHMGTILA